MKNEVIVGVAIAILGLIAMIFTIALRLRNPEDGSKITYSGLALTVIIVGLAKIRYAKWRMRKLDEGKEAERPPL